MDPQSNADSPAAVPTPTGTNAMTEAKDKPTLTRYVYNVIDANTCRKLFTLSFIESDPERVLKVALRLLSRNVANASNLKLQIVSIEAMENVVL